MTKLEHMNVGWIQVPGGPRASCHCLLLQDAANVALVDTGIGFADVCDPLGRFGRDLIDPVVFQFNAADALLKQLQLC